MSNDILAPHRCVGQVFGHVAAAYTPIPKSRNRGFISVPINNCVYTYKIEPFRLVWVSEPLRSTILVIARDRHRVFAADKSGIDVLNVSGMRIARFPHQSVSSKLRFIVPIGEVLVAIEDDGLINVYDLKTQLLAVEFEAPASSEITAALHPDTWFNEIILATSDGRIQTVNINTGFLVADFPPDAHFSVGITNLQQTPAVDIVACGLADGRVHLKNLRNGEMIMSFKQDGAVTAMSFRTDGIETFATTNAQGTIALWNLEAQTLIGQHTTAHADRIYSAFFLLGEPHLITCGGDNRIVRWFMENEVSLPIESKVLEGHSGEVTALKFVENAFLISAGLDGCVRRFNIYRPDLVKRLGIAREVKKGEVSRDRYIDVRLEPIGDMAVEAMREHVWDNVAAVHRGSSLVSTWSSRRQTKGAHIFCHERFTRDERYVGANATTAEITNAGDMCLVGYSSGHIDVYNMQSGKFRFTLPNPKLKSMMTKDARAHNSEIVAVCSALNSRDVISVAADGTVIWWSVEATPQCIRLLQCGAPITAATYDRESRLLAVALNTGDIKIYAAETARIARTFTSILSGGVTCTHLAISPHSTHLLVADSLAIIRMLDLRSMSVCGAVKCSQPCTHAAFSENGLYVATCHKEQSEIFVWTNRLMWSTLSYNRVPDSKLEVKSLASFYTGPFEPEPDIYELSDDDEVASKASHATVHTLVIDESEGEDEEMGGEDTKPMDVDHAAIEAAPLGEESGLHTLSGAPSHRWSTLPFIDIIKKRNTIKEVVKTVVNVPFFLDSTPNETDIIASAAERTFVAAARTDDEIWTEWARRLSSANEAQELTFIFSLLIQMTTPQIDFEIRSAPAPLLAPFVRMLIAQLETKRDVDFTHAILCTFLRAHRRILVKAAGKTHISAVDAQTNGDAADDTRQKAAAMSADVSMRKLLAHLRQAHTAATHDLQRVYNETLPVLKWIKSAVI